MLNASPVALGDASELEAGEAVDPDAGEFLPGTQWPLYTHGCGRARTDLGARGGSAGSYPQISRFPRILVARSAGGSSELHLLGTGNAWICEICEICEFCGYSSQRTSRPLRILSTRSMYPEHALLSITGDSRSSVKCGTFAAAIRTGSGFNDPHES
jgi:hypothetical protein